jgi:transcriptional regulator with XRE-family HTH domain
MTEMYTQTHSDVNTYSLLPRLGGFAYDSGMELPDRLQEKLNEKKLTAYSLAQLSKVPQPTIFRILIVESREPRRSTLTKLAKALGTTVDYLLLGIDEHDANNANARLRPPIIEDAEWNALSAKRREFIERLALSEIPDALIDALQSVIDAACQTSVQLPIATKKEPKIPATAVRGGPPGTLERRIHDVGKAKKNT